MALTYAAAERCLVLDQELQSITMKNLTLTQLNAHVMCSTWLTRSWTFQEARLSRAWYVQFEDGIYNPNCKANESLHFRHYADFNVFKSDEHGLASELISWYHAMPAVRLRNMDFNKNRRLFHSQITNIITIWNHLVSRSTSKMEDVHGILANTLDLSAGEVLALPAQQRMKAILRAQEKIPAVLVFTRANKVQDESCRWVPLYPQQSYLDESYGVLEPSHDGFFLDNVGGSQVGFLVDPSIPRYEKIRLVDPCTFKTCWIQVMQESDGRPVDYQAPGETVAICYLMGTWERSWRKQSVSSRYVGARFVLRKKEGMTWHLVFEYSFLYSHHQRWRPNQEEEDYVLIKAFERSTADVRFHIDSDLSSWPTLAYRRDTMNERSSHGRLFYILTWPSHVLLIWFSLYYFVISATHSRPIVFPTLAFFARHSLLIYETFKLLDSIEEHAYTAWVKTFDESGALRKKKKKSSEAASQTYVVGKRAGLYLAVGVQLLVVASFVTGMSYMRWFALAVFLELVVAWGCKLLWRRTRTRGWVKGWLKGRGWW
ncbi:MAG: hypothetical protein Q9222_005110 [Ikaeria aurantiellina]